MKSFLRSFMVFFLLFSFLFLFISCSQESAITSPNNIKVEPMAKAVVIPIVQFNHTTDTVITLPKSEKTLVIAKNTNQDQLALLDTYLQTHTISDKPAITFSPMLGYYTDTISYWELQNQYQPVSGKYLGIWTSALSPQILNKQYGFTYYFANNGLSSGRDTSVTNYFPIGNLLVPLPYDSTWTPQAIYNDLKTYPAYNYYYVDEPYENLGYGVFNEIESGVYQASTTAKLLFSDWWWPEYDLLCVYQMNNGNDIKTHFFPNANVYIMCDMYNGTPCGNVHDYWSEYKAYYGIPSRNISNWISMNHSNDWGDLLNLASPWGMNPIWIYGADAAINGSYFPTFASIAWQTGWLLRQEKYLTIIYQCSGTNCVYGVSGTWTVKTAYYTTTQYVHY